MPGVALAGALTLRVNTTGARVTQTFTVGGVTTTLDIEPGTSFAATGIAAEVLGQRLSGDFSVTSDGSTTTLTVTKASVSLAGGLASVSGASATVTLSSAGATGSFNGTVAFGVAGVSSSATLTAASTRPARLTATCGSPAPAST